MAFRKYGIRPSAEWERWHDAPNHFPNGSIPNIESASAVARKAVENAKANADLAVKVANISQKLAKDNNDADRAVSYARDAKRERDDVERVAGLAGVAMSRNDHGGAANATLEALGHAQNASQYAQLAADAASKAGTPPLIVDTTVHNARNLHEHAEEYKTGILAALRRYMARIGARG